MKTIRERKEVEGRDEMEGNVEKSYLERRLRS
jgi:hypothetical protein